MADYRLSAQVISRSNGRSSVAAAAYRSAERMVDERTGEIHDFTRKGGLVHEEILAPDNTPDWMRDRAQLWNAVEAAEKRKDAQLAREIQLSLPHELTAEQRLDLVRGFVEQQFVSRGMIADLAVHEPGKSGDDRNHHAHVMLTMRELTGEGFGKKNRDWNSPELLNEHRAEWARHQNHALERYGHEARVDHRSYEEQGIDREPTQHLGPTAHQMEFNGKASRIGDENRERLARNSDRAQDHQQAAALKLQIEREQRKFEWWADRKRGDLEHAHELAGLDLLQKHHRQKLNLEAELTREYGDHKATIRAELDTIDKKLAAKGVQRIIRDVFGRTSADRATREELTQTLGSIQEREAERTARLERQQKADLAKEQRRQQANRERLERGIDTARERRERESWRQRDYHKPRHDPPKETPQPTTNRDKAPPPEPKPPRDFWSTKPEKPVPDPKPSKDWWRSTSTTHKPEDAEFLKSRWDRSSNDNAADKRSPWDNDIFGSDPFSPSTGRGRDGPSPSPGGSGRGSGGSGSGGNSGGSGGGSSGGGGTG